MQVQEIFAPVQEEFLQVNETITTFLGSDVPLVDKIARYIVESGGKRLRPLLVLLAAKALNYQADKEQADDKHVRLAAIIEFLHTATLLHDDVVDESNLRRGKATANANWGNAPSVLVGDFMYSRAFSLMVSIGSMDIMDILAHATTVIAEGEVMQLTNVRNPKVDEAYYMKVIECKTAMLFEASSFGGGVIATGKRENADAQAMKHYGHHLGMAFQLVDDVLDYLGDSETLGKNVGDDLAEGKMTLPLIYSMANTSEDNQIQLRKIIRKGDTSQLDWVIALVKETGAIDYTRNAAKAHIEKAKAHLAEIPDSPYKTSLMNLAEFCIARVY